MRRDRLAVVFRLRQLDEQTAQLRMRDALAIEARAGNELALRTSLLADEQAWFARIQREPTSAGECQEAAQAVTAAALAREVAATRFDEATAAVAAARERLAAATRRREVVERLRDRYRELARREDERREIGRLADVATLQHVFRPSEAAR